MGIAKYFSKDLLAINQLLKSNNKNFEEILLQNQVGIAFDYNSVDTNEGIKALDLLVRLLARLYPNLAIIDLSGHNHAKTLELKKIAHAINSNIDVSSISDNIDVMIVAGYTKKTPKIKGKYIFLGSDKWNVKISQNYPQNFTNSDNPFGCGIAVCIAASNAFRIVFKDFLPDKDLDDNLEFSTLNYNNSDILYNPNFNKLHFNDVVLVGAGAIGNGCIWALTNIKNISGKLDIIDSETVSLSNLQRYVMFSEKDVNQIKVIIAAKYFKSKNFKIKPFQTTWEGYLQVRNDWNIETVAVAIDNKKDRIGIQSSLPKKIFNSYTETNLLGIARHTDFINSACLACGYIPSQKEKNYINEVAENCNIPNLSNAVKDYINLNLSVDTVLTPQNTSSLLDIIAQANNIDRNILNQFHGKKVNEFYSEFICGGISLSLSNNKNAAINVDAPLAFQSAMAGILLAVELISDVSNLRKSEIKKQSHFYPLNPIGQNNPFNHQLEKDKTGRCLCNDVDFKRQFYNKWLISKKQK